MDTRDYFGVTKHKLMVVHLCECAKNHWLVHIKWVDGMLCEVYLNKIMLQNNKQKDELNPKMW